MKHYSIRNIHIDYEGIQCERYVSKNKLKKVVYNYVYTKLDDDWLKRMEELNIQVGVWWHYGCDQPVLNVPAFDDQIGVMHCLGKDLGWFNKSSECSRYE